MKLQLDIHNIKDVQFGEKTTISDRVLYIDHHELQETLQQDKRLSKVDIELAHPGESCRILQVSDVVEPRAKTGGSGEDFPGFLGKRETVGEGSTCALRGVAVVMSDQSELCGPALNGLGNIIDMSGPGAELSRFAKTCNVVVIPYPADWVSPDEYKVALKLAGLKAAVYLAQPANKLKPDEVEVYELPPLPEVAKGIEDLPKVAYIFQVYCTSFPAIQGEPILYGDSLRRHMPTLIHPNEVLDGAVINPYMGMGIETYSIQNHPVIKDLYRRHGKELCFVGVILTVSHYTEPERERSVAIAANFAKSLLGADGVILTRSSAGAPDVDIAQMAQKCEEVGIKAVLIMYEIQDTVSDAGGGVVFNLPKAGAIIDTGCPLVKVTLPSMERIIGRPVTLPTGIPASGEMTGLAIFLSGAVGQLGDSNKVTVRY